MGSIDKNTILGILLIFLLFYLWAKMNAPTEAEMAEMEQRRDSLANIPAKPLESLPNGGSPEMQQPGETKSESAVDTSLTYAVLNSKFGPFSTSAVGTEKEYNIENNRLKISFTNKGGRINEVLLKDYFKLEEDENRKDRETPLFLMEDKKNRFEYMLPVKGVSSRFISTEDLFFEVLEEPGSITFQSKTGEGQFFEQKYELDKDSYHLNYSIRWVGLEDVFRDDERSIQLNWVNYLDKIEKNTQYERLYSSIYFKQAGSDPDHCSYRKNESETLSNRPVKWISHSNQFFNSTLIADSVFPSVYVECQQFDMDNEDLKMLVSQFKIPLGQSTENQFSCTWFIGPNKFDELRSFNVDFEDIIPFGASIFGTINRWVIRPLFNFISDYLGSKGLVIFFLTLVVKAVLYPLNYKMLYSQSKMGALKPEMTKLREKFKDDSQKVQMESMRIYREYGVNPAGGCLPMILQMPIWFALYRFFPAAIEFRQASFLWANDLSSYDVFFRLPVQLPLIGGHVSLFTLLWAVSILGYTYYNSKIMDMSTINPMMKYMQYLMPVMFIFFFNSYASGLTCYLLFSNMLNIGQTIITKNYFIDNEKILEELSKNKKKPKKQTGFQARLEKALKEQQKTAAERQSKTKKR